MDHLIGKRLDGRYQVTELIGAGGMANVYKAADLLENRMVAIKVLHDEFLNDEELMRRFKSELKVMRRLSHPNIVKIFDVHLSGAVQYWVMEFVDGVTVQQYIDALKLLRWKDTVYFAQQILKALRYAHDRGVTHRDIKPQNMMVSEDGTVKLTDFGFTREPIKGDITGNKDDLYDLGMTMYIMLTGTLPFEPGTPAEPISDGTREMAERIPKGLEDIVLRAIAEDPARRYQSAAQMLRDVKDFKRNPNVAFKYKHVNDIALERLISLTPAPSEAGKPARKREKKIRTKRPPRRSVFVGAGVALASLICAAVVFFFMAGAFDVQHADLPLPDFTMMNVKDVQTNPEYRKFNFDHLQEDYNANYPAGVIYDQNPLPGRLVKDNSHVTLYVSLGPKEVMLPDVVGMTSGEAKVLLRQYGLRVIQIRGYDPRVEANKVLSMSPVAGSRVFAGAQDITIIVNVIKGGSSTAIVPDVVGMKSAEAANELGKRTLRVGTVSHEDSSAPKGTVLAQGITPGTKVTMGTAIDLVISNGQEYSITFSLPYGQPNGGGGYYLYNVEIYIGGVFKQRTSASAATSLTIPKFEVLTDGVLIEVVIVYNGRYSFLTFTAYNSYHSCVVSSGPNLPPGFSWSPTPPPPPPPPEPGAAMLPRKRLAVTMGGRI